jgi:microcystin degradation protein MlrC
MPGTLGVNVSIAGFLASAATNDWDVVPALWCAASPSGPVTADAFERIADELLARLAAALPLDGVYLDLHGAMVAETFDDGEGELLRRVRRTVGPGVPIIASLDLHGNVTAAMVAEADVLVAFRTYPHVDMAETGARAATILSPLIGSRLRPAKAFRQLPFLIPIVWQCTDVEPCRSLYADLARMEREGGAALSFLPGFPAADFPDCRPSVLAYARTQQEADAAADRLAERVIAAEAAFDGELFLPDDAVARATAGGRPGKPFILADTQDNPGAGSGSDSTGMLRALVRAGASNAALGLIVDASAAAAAHRAGVGATIRLALGGHSGIPDDTPFEADFVVERLSNGAVRTSGSYYGASTMDLGPSACLRIGGVRIVVASHKAQMADLEMFRFVGIEPRD